MSQPPREPPTTPNSGETTASGPTYVQEVPTTDSEEGDENLGPGEDLQARRIATAKVIYFSFLTYMRY
jgi:hypothetical protein